MLVEQINDPKYRQFILDVIASQTVYSLCDNEDFFAECPSEEFDTAWGEPVGVQCFWAHQNQAVACRQQEWADYAYVGMSLEDFMQEVLLELDDMEKLVGVAFDDELYGIEVEPIDLLGDLLNEIEAQGLEDTISEFDELRQYCLAWQAKMMRNQTIH